jgi:dUTP pyrophosphatase
MTIISEKQAYLMGWAYNINSTPYNITDEFNMNPHELNKIVSDPRCRTIGIFGFADYSLLEDVRRIDFMRGFFDRTGKIHAQITVEFDSTSLNIEMMSVIDALPSSPGLWEGINAIEFLATMYYPGVTHYSIDNYLTFTRLAYPHEWGITELPSFKWMKTDDNAVAPVKNRFSDAGFDLTVIKKMKVLDGVYYYDTGISVEPQNGYYFEIVGRSSISKTGWMLANNIGIIDASYRGSIIVALVRVNPDACEIETPMRLVQMIPRKMVAMNGFETVSLSDTKRGYGGFGSSG